MITECKNLKDMKTTIKRTMHYGLVCLLLCLLAGCKKAPMNSNIEGFWQLLEFTTQADGETHPCNRIYYSIQLWVAEVSERGGDLGITPFRGRYRYDEETNTITEGNEYLCNSGKFTSGYAGRASSLRTGQYGYDFRRHQGRREITDPEIGLCDTDPEAFLKNKSDYETIE